MLAGCLIASVTGCSKKEEQAQQAAEEMSKSMQKIAQNMGNNSSNNGAANHAPGVVIPSKTLAGFLPSVSGYTSKGEPETMEMDFQGAKYAHANQTYENGDKRITVSILDYNYIAGLSAAYSAMMGMSYETNEESLHSEQFSGNPGWISWKKGSKTGTVGVFVNNRIFVIIEGHDDVSLDELKSVANSINYSGIASAAK